MNLGLIGYPLGHSFSPSYFKGRFIQQGLKGHSYHALAVEDLKDFKDLVKQHNWSGFNVTLPHKQSIISQLDIIDKAAAEIGAVNCVAIRNGKWIGYNTDYMGFSKSLVPLLEPHHTSALILGDGGAALAVKYALNQLGISFVSVTRSGSLKFSDLHPSHITEHTIIINCTPIGMHPNEEDAPDLPYEAIGSRHLLYDLIYNPEQTKFLKKGALLGARTKSGLEMLHLQAEASWQIWNSTHHQAT